MSMVALMVERFKVPDLQHRKLTTYIAGPAALLKLTCSAVQPDALFRAKVCTQ